MENPACFDLISTNRPNCFQNSNVFETKLSDFHKLTFTVLEVYFQEQKPKVMIEATKNLITNCLEIIFIKNYYQINVRFKRNQLRLFTAQYIFDRHAPLEEKHVRCNQAIFVNKNLRMQLRLIFTNIIRCSRLRF